MLVEEVVRLLGAILIDFRCCFSEEKELADWIGLGLGLGLLI